MWREGQARERVCKGFGSRSREGAGASARRRRSRRYQQQQQQQQQRGRERHRCVTPKKRLTSIRVSEQQTRAPTRAPRSQHYSPLDRDIDVREVAQDKVDKLLVLVLADVLDEAGGLELLAEAVGSEAVLGEAKVERVEDTRN